jgi:phage recombination protein Bet
MSKKDLVSAQQSGPLVPCRLPMPAAELASVGLDPGTWAVLTDIIFPGAKTPQGVMRAVRYCQRRGLDVMKRPVHVVAMWSSAAGREVETVWPGIAEVQTTAARTGQWAGMDPAKFGPDKTRRFEGSVKRGSGFEEVSAEVTYPEWVEVTVYRLIGGVRCPFTETVFWEEAYARIAPSDVPNAMWQKRPRGQLLKCGKAASLRAGFPEEAGYTAEEMAGKAVDAEDVAVIDAEAVTVEASKPKPTKPAPQSQPDGDPPKGPKRPEPPKEIPPESVSDELRARVLKLVDFAEAKGAWGQALTKLRKELQGNDLAYAEQELRKAQEKGAFQAPTEAQQAA